MQPASESLVTQFRRARGSSDLVVLEGFHALKHAVRFDAAIHVAVTSDLGELEGLAAGLAPDLTQRLASLVREVPREILRELVPQEPHTHVVAIAARPTIDASAVLRSETSDQPIVALEDPRNLGNLGAVVRVAAAAGAAAVITTGMHDPWEPLAIRGSAGLHYALPVARADSIRPHGRPLLAIDPEGDVFRPEDLPRRSVLAFGTERGGLSDEVRAAADARIRIPMQPGVSSLNLATSVAAILFSWRLTGGRPVSEGRGPP
jgi:RNA methyltransferase, TrmH family